MYYHIAIVVTPRLGGRKGIGQLIVFTSLKHYVPCSIFKKILKTLLTIKSLNNQSSNRISSHPPVNYLWLVEDFLNNPVYHALLLGDAHLGGGSGNVRFFNADVSPFAGFSIDNKAGFNELHQQLPQGRNILFASRQLIEPPKGWQQIVAIEGLQFVFPHNVPADAHALQPTPLSVQHVDEMIELTALTKPGPFGKRTIEFGHYYGFFENDRLAAMAGQRLHVGNYTEISAVCTHPQHLGKGFAGALLLHQIALIRQQGQTPFLHVRADNDRAIALYKRLGFEVNGPMNFYFLKTM